MLAPADLALDPPPRGMGKGIDRARIARRVLRQHLPDPPLPGRLGRRDRGRHRKGRQDGCNDLQLSHRCLLRLTSGKVGFWLRRAFCSLSSRFRMGSSEEIRPLLSASP